MEGNLKKINKKINRNKDRIRQKQDEIEIIIKLNDMLYNEGKHVVTIIEEYKILNKCK
jgi:hypothetical protein